MTDRNDHHELGWLGAHLGECTVVQGPKAQTTVHEFQEGWSLVAVRRGPEPRHPFRAMLKRCILPNCTRKACLGHPEAVAKLATKIRSTYR